ncbi:MAG: leucine-rich repeat protein [Lachnospiraceae bacterium]|nr:leucine-rich repeat protein [Lachnospiraceae bacterium]
MRRRLAMMLAVIMCVLAPAEAVQCSEAVSGTASVDGESVLSTVSEDEDSEELAAASGSEAMVSETSQSADSSNVTEAASLMDSSDDDATATQTDSSDDDATATQTGTSDDAIASQANAADEAYTASQANTADDANIAVQADADEDIDSNMGVDAEDDLDSDMGVDAEGSDDGVTDDSDASEEEEPETSAGEEEIDATADDDSSEDVSTTGYSGTCGASGNTSGVYWQLSEDGVLTISGSGDMMNYSAEDESFAPWNNYCSEITSIVIESGVTSIGDYAFMNCTSLTSVTIPNTVTYVGGCSFYQCTSLPSITIPDSVTSMDVYTFMYCTSLTSVNLSSNLTTIGEMTFAGCTSLPSISIPEGVTTIEDSAFTYCTSLTSVMLPASLISMGDYVFSDCTALAEISVASGNAAYASVDGVLFNKAQTVLMCYPVGKTDSSYSVPSGVTTIYDSAFYGCSSLASVTLPDSVTSIEEYAFADCTRLTQVSLGSGVTTIGECAFLYCTGLTSITLPASVTSIEAYAFSSCKNLAAVYYQSSKTAWKSIAIGDSNTYLTSAAIYYSIAGCVIAFSPAESIYDGTAKTPSVTVTDGSTTLTAGTDYSSDIAYSNNTEIGTATVTVTGMGSYTGTLGGSFRIYKGDIATGSIMLSQTSYIYDGTAKKPEVAVTVGGETLTLGADYTVIYSDNRNAGTASVTVTGAGEYTGTAVVNFEIQGALADTVITSLTNKKAGIAVTWEEIAGADGYYIYRKNGSGSDRKIATIANASTVSYTDKSVKNKNRKTYTYRVIAYSGSTTSSCTAKKIVRLTRPTLSSVKNTSSKKVTVKWKKVTKVTGYQIQYSTSKTFASGKTKSVKVKGAARVQKVLSKLKKGKTYYVRIRTYYKKGSATYYSAWSAKRKVAVKKMMSS